MDFKITEQELKEFKLSEEEVKMIRKFEEAIKEGLLDGNYNGALPRFTQMLSTPSAQVLIPKVIVGAMREVTEPMYIGTKLYQRVRLEQGQSMIFPSIGAMRAYDVAEGQEIPEETLDFQTHETTEIRVKKSAVRVRFTEEMVQDSQWDIIAMSIREAGRALARHKEQKAFREFSIHGHVVFDNAIRSQYPEAGTRGLDKDGNYNDTLSAEDFLDLIIAVMANEYTPTDILMHPLTWTVFAKNELAGALQASPYLHYPAKGNPKTMALGPESIQGRLPFGFNVQLSPFIPFDTKTKRFDMYVVDRNNIGVQLVKTDLKVDKFTDPAVDIHNVKMVERYGFGVLNQGKAIAVARNIALEKSYAEPITVRNI
ncbi:MAG: phage major capsid protein [Ignavibacterium sp.]|nr:phage major capsid protein [Ignavibacterium sp.]